MHRHARRRRPDTGLYDCGDRRARDLGGPRGRVLIARARLPDDRARGAFLRRPGGGQRAESRTIWDFHGDLGAGAEMDAPTRSRRSSATNCAPSRRSRAWNASVPDDAPRVRAAHPRGRPVRFPACESASGAPLIAVPAARPARMKRQGSGTGPRPSRRGCARQEVVLEEEATLAGQAGQFPLGPCRQVWMLVARQASPPACRST
jgi:hypothetical protein